MAVVCNWATNLCLVEVVEFDNHSPLGEGVGGRELGAHA